MVALCVHCGLRPGSRPKGLCWVCYKNRAVRGRTPLKGPTGKRYSDAEMAKVEVERT